MELAAVAHGYLVEEVDGVESRALDATGIGLQIERSSRLDLMVNEFHPRGMSAIVAM